MASTSQKVIEVFRKCDKEGDGLVPKQTLAAVLHALCPEAWSAGETDAIFKAYGRLRGDSIHYCDFFHWLHGKRWNLVKCSTGKLSDAHEVDDKILGEGGFGTVRKARLRRESSVSTEAVRAVKSILKKKDCPEEIEVQRHQLDTEINVMKTLEHPNIIKLYEVFEDAQFMHLVMEFCAGGELLELVVQELRFTERQAAWVMRQLVGALSYLRLHAVCHRDLKLQNLLVSEKKCRVDNCIIKIVDFGYARILESGSCLMSMVGTPYYVAPEVLEGVGYTHAVDMWASGVIMYILLSGSPPFQGKGDAGILQSVKQGGYTFPEQDWNCISESAKSFVRIQLDKNPTSRCTPDQGLDHVWVKNLAPESTEVPLQSHQLHNMQAFSNNNKLKKAAVHLIAGRLKESEILGLKNIFSSLDKNGDGLITYSEMKEAIRRLDIDSPLARMATNDIMAVISDIDTDWDGFISYSEFIAATLDKKHYHEEQICWEAFQVFDIDGNGVICRKDLLQALTNSKVSSMFGEIAISRVMQECDTDGSDGIDFDNFMKMMRAS